MTDRSTPARSTSHLSSSLAPASHNTDSSSVRPRNRRLISTVKDQADLTASSSRSSGLLSAFAPSTSRSGSPLPSSRSPSRSASPGNLGQFLGDSWNQSWSSIQGLTSSILAVGDAQAKSPGKSPARGSSTSRPGTWGRASSSTRPGKTAVSWGPEPPSSQPSLNDVASGSVAQRESALKAARTASILESHEGVNGGLDVTGRHKRRNSDDVTPSQAPPEDYLVYVHSVQTNDTYAGLILRYKCREDAFRKANGLWSRDTVQTRKWLIIPVDACEIRGRPCDPPSWHNSHGVDLLAPTPSATVDDPDQRARGDGFFGQTASDEPTEAKLTEEEEKPWAHVRWVQIESFPQPVEIGRVARQALGYFPPRRRKSIRTMSTFSTPRQSIDLSGALPGSAEGPTFRRMSSSSSRPRLSGTPVSNRSRVGSEGADGRPAWMRRPGGVGSMGRNVRAPGPGRDYFNTWTTKHIPGLNMGDLPSMSVMGSEVANFGFKGGEASGLVESPFEEGRDATSTSRQGTGLDRAAAAVETWLRGALAKRPSTPIIGNRGRSMGRPTGDGDGDLIELADTASDDGRAVDPTANLLGSLSLLGTSSRSEGDGFVRGRTMGTTGLKGQKAD